MSTEFDSLLEEGFEEISEEEFQKGTVNAISPLSGFVKVDCKNSSNGTICGTTGCIKFPSDVVWYEYRKACADGRCQRVARRKCSPS